MSFSSGTFTINTAGQPVVTGTTISSTAFNLLTADLATGLSTCVLKDGTQTTTAPVPFATSSNTPATAGTCSVRGGQIGFPSTQVASTDANTLDDYQEAVAWTPVDSSGAGLSLTIVDAQAYKIGQMAFVYASITFPATADATVILIGGLPYTAKNTTGNPIGSAIYATTYANASYCSLIHNTKTFNIKELGGNASLANSSMSTKAFSFLLIYPTTA